MASSASSFGLRRGSLVALSAANGPGFLGTFLGLRQAGCPVLLLDWRTPKAAKLRIARALGCAAILHCPSAWPRRQDLSFESLQRDLPKPQATPLDPDIAVVKLTSGSTGLPRGILTPAEALVADDAALADSMGLRPEERIVSSVPMSHSYGLSSIVMPALMRDAVLITPEDDNPLAPLGLASEQHATFLPTVPAFLQALVKRQSPPPLPKSMRLVISAGAPLQPETARRFRDVYGQPVHVFYGASEAGGITFDRDGGAAERGTLGSPVTGVEVRLDPLARDAHLVDVKNLESVSAVADAPDTDAEPRHAVSRGSVTITSAAVARGYLEAVQRVAANEDRPSDDAGDCAPWQRSVLEDGTFRTRDLASWQAGELKLEGRLDDLINVKGKKVNPREVEAVLGRLEGVEEAVVLGVPRPGGDHLVRAFVATPPGALSYETVQAWCRRHLAEHKVPRSILLLEAIPRTSRGKVDRAALLALQPLVRRGGAA